MRLLFCGSVDDAADPLLPIIEGREGSVHKELLPIGNETKDDIVGGRGSQCSQCGFGFGFPGNFQHAKPLGLAANAWCMATLRSVSGLALGRWWGGGMCRCRARLSKGMYVYVRLLS